MSESERKAFPEVLGELESALEEISKSHELELREHAVLCAARIYISQLQRCLREGVSDDVTAAVAACEGRGLTEELTIDDWKRIKRATADAADMYRRLWERSYLPLRDVFGDLANDHVETLVKLDAIIAKLGHKP